jgi:hypothetical protein
MCLLTGGLLNAQEAALPLSSIKSTPTAEISRPLMLPVECDESGNIYYRGYQFPEPGLAPVVRMSPRGQKELEISLKGNDPKVEEIFSYQISPNGEVAMGVGAAGAEAYILRFRKDGSLLSKTKLAEPMIAYKLFVFGDGNILASGTTVPSQDVPAKVVTRIYDATGQVIKTLTFAEDEYPPKKKRGKENEDQGRSIESLGMMLPGPEGNLLLVKGPSAPIVRLMDSTGRVIRESVIPVPVKNATFENAKVMQGKIVAQFIKRTLDGMIEKAVYSVVEPFSSAPPQNYNVSPETGFAFACASPDEFSFLTSKDRVTQLTRVPLH